MKRFFALCMILSLSVGFAGCDKKTTEVKKETTVKTPGGETKETDVKTTEKSGDHKEDDVK